MPSIRSLPLSSVKSLSATEAAALKRIGIDNTKELLEAASSTSAERALAKKAGLPTSVVREAVNRADLLNVKGVGKSTADLFENVGVNSAKELAQRNPVALARSLEAFVKSHPDQARWLPSAATITTLVENAKPFAATPVRSWSEAEARATSALSKHIDGVLFSNHPDGAAFREAILAHRPQSEWPQVRDQLHAAVANLVNAVPLSTGGAPSGGTRTETATQFTWEGALLGLYTELQVNKATGSIDKLFIEID